MESKRANDVIQLHPNDDRVAGPLVTPAPVPADDMVLKLSLAAAAGAALGSFVVWRWLSGRIVVRRRP